MSLSCRGSMCTNDDFMTSHQASSACFAHHFMHDIATVICGSVRALLSRSSAACQCLIVNIVIRAACVLVVYAWPPHALILYSNTFLEECINISGMQWHVMELVVPLAVALPRLAASKSMLSRLCRDAVLLLPRTVMQAFNTSKQVLSAHSARRSRSWHDGVFSTLK